jgi:hypothetical protein
MEFLVAEDFWGVVDLWVVVLGRVDFLGVEVLLVLLWALLALVFVCLSLVCLTLVCLLVLLV